jgi:hypothetical protein
MMPHACAHVRGRTALSAVCPGCACACVLRLSPCTCACVCQLLLISHNSHGSHVMALGLGGPPAHVCPCGRRHAMGDGRRWAAALHAPRPTVRRAPASSLERSIASRRLRGDGARGGLSSSSRLLPRRGGSAARMLPARSGLRGGGGGGAGSRRAAVTAASRTGGAPQPGPSSPQPTAVTQTQYPVPSETQSSDQ